MIRISRPSRVKSFDTYLSNLPPLIYRIALTACFLLIAGHSLLAQRTPTQGELDKFVDGVSISVRSVRLTDDRVLIFYKNSSASTGSTMKAVIGTVSGSNISYGTTKDVAADAFSFIEVVALSSTKAAVFYEVNTTTDILRYQILDISGNSITVNAAGTLGDGDQVAWRASLRATALSSTSVVVTYERDGTPDQGVLVAGTVSGSTISWGTTVVVDDDVFYTDIVRLTATKFAMVYQHDGGSDNGKILAGTVSGNTITKGTSQTFESSSAIARVGIAALSETEVVVAYEDDGSTSPVDPGKIFYATVSGTVFTINAKTSFHSAGGISDVDLEALSATEVLVVVSNQGSPGRAVYWVGLLSGTSITIADAGTEFRAGEADDANPTVLTSDLAVLNYTDDNAISGTTDAGESRVLTLTATTNPEIDVQGNSTLIESGDITPASGDHTDFGTGGSLSRTFTIQNNGSGTLTLGSNAVSITGTNAADFSVNTQPATSVSGSSSTTFVIDFSSAVASTRSAVIHINSNDIHEPDYIFNIQAVGAAVPTSAVVAATVFLEGAYNGSNLNKKINGSIPLTQPYSINGHSGGTAVSIPTNAVDWVLIELREAGSAAAALNSTKKGSTAGFLMTDGTIKATDGTSDVTVSLSGNSGADFYVVIYHRNHLPIMSANAVSNSGGKYTIDFTSASANTYQTTTALVSLSGSKFGMPAGDTDGDGDIDATDLGSWRTNNGAVFSYSSNGATDFNLDGVINAVDRNDYHQKNTSKSRQVPTT